MQDKDESLQPHSSPSDENIRSQYNLLKNENEKLLAENEILKKKLQREELYHKTLYKQWSELNASVSDKSRTLQQLKSAQHPRLKVYKYAFYILLLITVLLIVINYAYTANRNKNADSIQTSVSEKTGITQAGNGQMLDSFAKSTDKKKADSSVKKEFGKYAVKVKSYFYNTPDINTRRNTFVLPWKDEYGILTALDDKNGFIYIEFTNRAGRISKGWINKNDLEPVKK